jgi:hypothetical protein
MDAILIGNLYQLVILAFAQNGYLKHKVFIGNLSRKAALLHHKPFCVMVR